MNALFPNNHSTPCSLRKSERKDINTIRPASTMSLASSTVRRIFPLLHICVKPGSARSSLRYIFHPPPEGGCTSFRNVPAGFAKSRPSSHPNAATLRKNGWDGVKYPVPQQHQEMVMLRKCLTPPPSPPAARRQPPPEGDCFPFRNVPAGFANPAHHLMSIPLPARDGLRPPPGHSSSYGVPSRRVKRGGAE